MSIEISNILNILKYQNKLDILKLHRDPVESLKMSLYDPDLNFMFKYGILVLKFSFGL